MNRTWPHHHGILTIDGVSAADLAAEFDTPLYVTEGVRVQACYRALRDAFMGSRPTIIAYAAKANTNLALLRILEREGATVDCVSPGEVHAALSAGFPVERIHCTGSMLRTDELAWLVEQRVALNIDSLSMARRLVALTSTAQDFGVRINPGVGAGHHEHVVTGSTEAKFGVHAGHLPELCALLHAKGHRLTRLHAHIGSGVVEPAPFLALIDAMAEIAEALNALDCVAIDTIDLGGGIGIPYRPDDTALDATQFATAIAARMDARFAPEITLMLEPGRFLVADSTILLTRVTTVKATPHTTFVGVDAGFHTLLRPALYDAYHHIVAASRMDVPHDTPFAVCGPICETGDAFGADRLLPAAMAEGDLLALCDTGAYGFVMASPYNSRPRPAEVLVWGGTASCTRRRETLADLAALQTIPDALQA